MDLRRTGAVIAATLLAMFILLAVKSGGRVRVNAGAAATHGPTVTVTGPTVALAHGIVQVRVTVVSGRLTDVTAVQLPHDNPQSWQDSSAAAPILRSEALASQSAEIDVVSGATYTSRGYARSLQAALDAAGLKS
jgi:uncharacterized protein with FMN-binding domain